jgi:hypothetical protein
MGAYWPTLPDIKRLEGIRDSQPLRDDRDLRKWSDADLYCRAAKEKRKREDEEAAKFATFTRQQRRWQERKGR